MHNWIISLAVLLPNGQAVGFRCRQKIKNVKLKQI
jgi:hypothetical protein